MRRIKLLITALLLTVCSITNAQTTKEKFKAVLENFCIAYYETAFSGKQYIEGSLTISTLELDEANNIIKIRGKHSYRGQYIPLFGRKTHSNVDYKANISFPDLGIKIKFWKWYEPDLTDPEGHWEGPCEKTIIL